MSNCIDFKDRMVYLTEQQINLDLLREKTDPLALDCPMPVWDEQLPNGWWWWLSTNLQYDWCDRQHSDPKGVWIRLNGGRSTHTNRDFLWLVKYGLSPFMKERVEFEKECIDLDDGMQSFRMRVRLDPNPERAEVIY